MAGMAKKLLIGLLVLLAVVVVVYVGFIALVMSGNLNR
jgi:hypothetical protein